MKWIGKPIVRKDALGKVTGETKYMTDLYFPDMLYGVIVRAGVPHARILSINTSDAERYPGVCAVVTYRDVPGLNAYGIEIQDQPVFAQEKVRYEAEAVAGVVAETREIAKAAAKKIEIIYEELPGIFNPREGMRSDALKIHDKGNVHLHTHVKNGDVETAFQEADIVIENEYHLSMQQQGYLEVEGGVGLYRDGMLTIWCGSQYPTQDQRQLSSILGIPSDRIRVVSSPVGGGFGGKDDLTIQAQLAVMAYKTGKPVKVVHKREESFKSCWKRHPFFIKMKTAAMKDGVLVANKTEIVADTGAYAGLGGPVVNLAIEHSCGAYRVPNIDVEGYCVFTNNSLCSAMRGFGVPQITFAMESQIDQIATELGLDKLEIRLINGLRTGDQAPLGHILSTSIGTIDTLLKARESQIWRDKDQYKKSAPPGKKRGIGVATSIQGVGLGAGIPDYSAADITLDENGNFTVAVGCPDIGQGNSIAFIQMAAEALSCTLSEIILKAADTACTPDSGITAASRTIYAAGNAILLAADQIRQQMMQIAAEHWTVNAAEIELGDSQLVHRDRKMSYQELAGMALRRNIEIRSHGYFDMPSADKGIEGAFGLPHALYGSITCVALVEVDTITGQVHVLKVVSAPDAGRIINRQGLEGQAEGGVVMGLGYALMEKVIFNMGRIINDNFDTYLMPTALDCPEIIVTPVEVIEKSGPFGAKGIGECTTGPIAPAILNAIYDAVGVRIMDLPVSMEKIFFGGGHAVPGRP